MDQETAVVESELSPSAESDLKPCSDPGSSFSLTRVSLQKLDANPWVGLTESCLLPFLPASLAAFLRLCCSRC